MSTAESSEEVVRMPTSATASDIGLIIQGTLILLSAVVAVVGYYVQARLKSKERAKEIANANAARNTEMRLERLRSKVSDFVGPASQQCLNIVTGFGYLSDKFKEWYPDEMQRWQDEQDALGFSTKRMYQGHWNKSWTIIGKYCEDILKDESSISPKAKQHRDIYCMNMRAIVENFVGPLSELIQRYGQHLQHWGDKDEYKKRFPCAASNGLLRNLFPTQLCRFHVEFKEILKMWDKGDYSLLFPVVNPFPKAIVMHFMRMLTALRELENEAGIASHAVYKDDQQSSSKAEEEKIEKKVSAALKKKKGKYAVVAATAGSVAGGVVASVVGRQ